MFLNLDKGIKKYKVLQTNDKFLMTFNRKGVPLTSSKILSFEYEKKIYAFLLHFTHLSVSLQRFKCSYEKIIDIDHPVCLVSMHDSTDTIYH